MSNPIEPTKGRTVFYAFFNRYGNLVSRPAVIVNVHSHECVNLQVFTDGEDDGVDQAGGLWRRTSVLYDDAETSGCWRWPPRA